MSDISRSEQMSADEARGTLTLKWKLTEEEERWMWRRWRVDVGGGGAWGGVGGWWKKMEEIE